MFLGNWMACRTQDGEQMKMLTLISRQTQRAWVWSTYPRYRGMSALKSKTPTEGFKEASFGPSVCERAEVGREKLPLGVAAQWTNIKNQLWSVYLANTTRTLVLTHAITASPKKKKKSSKIYTFIWFACSCVNVFLLLKTCDLSGCFHLIDASVCARTKSNREQFTSRRFFKGCLGERLSYAPILWNIACGCVCV